MTYTLPAGFTDTLFDQCRAKRLAENAVRAEFESRGYSEVMTPSVEYADAFALSGDSYKLFDREGRVCVLRPDSTTPIARVTATRLQRAVEPIRIYYTQNFFRRNDQFAGRRNEVTQSGAELIGADGIRADAELLSLAIDALTAVGLGDFRLELGHIGFYKALDAKIPFEPADREAVRTYTDQKNYSAVADILDRYRAAFPDATRAMSRLPALFGGPEVFDEAALYFTDPESGAVLDYMRKLYALLVELGYEDRILLDFGLVHHLDYYTGVVFGGFAIDDGRSDAVLSGGRYDNLHASFGAPRPAIGFALDMDAVSALLPDSPARDGAVLVHYFDGHAAEAYAFQRSLTSCGQRCEISVFSSLDETKKYAEARGFASVKIFGGEAAE